jgi:hypothetical protein
MNKIIITLLAITAACGTTPTQPDAALPSCISLGCGDNGDSLCTADGRCSCRMETCQRENNGGFHHDAGVD